MIKANKKSSLFYVFRPDIILFVIFIVVISVISIFIDPLKFMSNLIYIMYENKVVSIVLIIIAVIIGVSGYLVLRKILQKYESDKWDKK